MMRLLAGMMVVLATHVVAAGSDAEPFRLDEILRRDGVRHHTLGPTGRRLFADRIEEAPGFLGVFRYLHGGSEIRDPVRLEFRGEDGPLVASDPRTVWRPSHLEVTWRLESDGNRGIELRLTERKFVGEDDVLVDAMLLENLRDEPVFIEVSLAGDASPTLERYRSRQIGLDTAPAANLAVPAGARLFAGPAEAGDLDRLPASVDYDGVRYRLVDGEDPARPRLVALRGGGPGDPAGRLPETATIELPDLAPAVLEIHLLAAVASRGPFSDASPASLAFLLDDGGSETVPFPPIVDRIAGGGDSAARGARDVRPPESVGPVGGRASWHFLALPEVTAPCLQLTYAPPPGRFVRRIVFARGKDPSSGEVPLILGGTIEIPPREGRLPVLLGGGVFHGLPVGLALAGEGFVPARGENGRRVLRRSLVLPPGASAAASVVCATGRRDRDAARAALAQLEVRRPLERHVARYRRWFDEYVPSFECSDPLLEKAWHYRWFLVRHCRIRAEAPPLTAPVFLEGLHGSEAPSVTTFATPFVLAETRWLRDPIFAVGQLRAHLRNLEADGLFRDVRLDALGGTDSYRIPQSALGVYEVHPSREYLEEVVGLLARNVDGAIRLARSGVPVDGAAVRGSAFAVARGYSLLGEPEAAATYRKKGEAVDVAESETPIRERLAEPFRDAAEASRLLDEAGRARQQAGAGAPSAAGFEDAFRRYVRMQFEEGDPARPLVEGNGVDSFRSTFADLVVRFVAGVVPSPGEILDVRPLVTGLDHFRLCRILYHGRELEIVWVRPGAENPHAGRREGFTVLVDGDEAAHRPGPGPILGIRLE
jgi:hypothetical protein